MPERKAPATRYTQIARRFWVAEDAVEMLGCVACKPAAEGDLELEKLSVARSARRGGLGGRLLDLVEAAARQAGVITLWSDTRFEAAHALYAVRGFRRTGLDDASLSVEYSVRKDLSGRSCPRISLDWD